MPGNSGQICNTLFKLFKNAPNLSGLFLKPVARAKTPKPLWDAGFGVLRIDRCHISAVTCCNTFSEPFLTGGAFSGCRLHVGTAVKEHWFYSFYRIGTKKVLQSHQKVLQPVSCITMHYMCMIMHLSGAGVGFEVREGHGAGELLLVPAPCAGPAVA